MSVDIINTVSARGPRWLCLAFVLHVLMFSSSPPSIRQTRVSQCDFAGNSRLCSGDSGLPGVGLLLFTQTAMTTYLAAAVDSPGSNL